MLVCRGRLECCRLVDWMMPAKNFAEHTTRLQEAWMAAFAVVDWYDPGILVADVDEAVEATRRNSAVWKWSRH